MVISDPTLCDGRELVIKKYYARLARFRLVLRVRVCRTKRRQGEKRREKTRRIRRVGSRRPFRKRFFTSSRCRVARARLAGDSVYFGRAGFGLKRRSWKPTDGTNGGSSFSA